MKVARCPACELEMGWEEIYVEIIPNTLPRRLWGRMNDVVLYRCGCCLCPELEMIEIPEIQAGWERLWL